jgi:Transmembrane protein 254
MEIPEGDWLKVGFYWMAVELAATVPPLSHFVIGEVARWLFDLTVTIHIVEAFYSISVTRRAGLDRGRWFLRTLFLGYFSVRRFKSAAPANA